MESRASRATLPGAGNGHGHRPADGVESPGDLGTEVVLVQPRLAGLHHDQSIIGLDVDHRPPVVGQDPERGASALLLVEPLGAFDFCAIGRDGLAIPTPANDGQQLSRFVHDLHTTRVERLLREVIEPERTSSLFLLYRGNENNLLMYLRFPERCRPRPIFRQLTKAFISLRGETSCRTSCRVGVSESLRTLPC